MFLTFLAAAILGGVHGAIVNTFSDSSCTIAAGSYQVFSDGCTLLSKYSAGLLNCSTGGSATLALYDDGLSLYGTGAKINCTGSATQSSASIFLPVSLASSTCTAIVAPSGATWRYASVDTTSSACTLGTSTAYNVALYSASTCAPSSLASDGLVVVQSSCLLTPGGSYAGTSGALTVSLYSSKSTCLTSTSSTSSYALGSTLGVCGGASSPGYAAATTVLPFPPTSLTTQLCASPPLSLGASTTLTSTLSCYNGMMDIGVSALSGVVLSPAHYPFPAMGAGGSGSFVGYAGGVATTLSAMPSPPFSGDAVVGGGSVACVAATATLLGIQRRVYSGLVGADAATLLRYLSTSAWGGGGGNLTSLIICSTAGCNAPFSGDACPLATRDSYSPGSCYPQTWATLPTSEPGTATSIPALVSTSLSAAALGQTQPAGSGSGGVYCYTTLGPATAPTSTFWPTSYYCWAATRVCSATTTYPALDDCYGQKDGARVRSYGAAAVPWVSSTHFFPATTGVSGGPTTDTTGGLHEVFQCSTLVTTTTGTLPCNHPSYDTCAWGVSATSTLNTTTTSSYSFTALTPTATTLSITLSSVPGYPLPLATPQGVAAVAGYMAGAAYTALAASPGCALADLSPINLTLGSSSSSSSSSSLFAFTSSFQGNLTAGVLKVKSVGLPTMTLSSSTLPLYAPGLTLPTASTPSTYFLTALLSGTLGTVNSTYTVSGTPPPTLTTSTTLSTFTQGVVVGTAPSATTTSLSPTLTFNVTYCSPAAATRASITTSFYTTFNTTLVAYFGTTTLPLAPAVILPSTATYTPSPTYSASPPFTHSPTLTPSTTTTTTGSLSPSGSKGSRSNAPTPSPFSSLTPSSSPTTCLTATSSSTTSQSVPPPTSPTQVAPTATTALSPSPGPPTHTNPPSPSSGNAAGGGGTPTPLVQGTPTPSRASATPPPSLLPTPSPGGGGASTATSSATSSSSASATASGTTTGTPTLTATPSCSPTLTPPVTRSPTPTATLTPRLPGTSPTPTPSPTPILAAAITTSLYIPFSSLPTARTLPGDLSAPMLSSAARAFATALKVAANFTPSVVCSGVITTTPSSFSNTLLRQVRGLQAGAGVGAGAATAPTPTGFRLFFTFPIPALASSPYIQAVATASVAAPGVSVDFTSPFILSSALSAAQLYYLPAIIAAMVASPDPSISQELGGDALPSMTSPFSASAILPYSASPSPSPGAFPLPPPPLQGGVIAAIVLGALLLATSTLLFWLVSTGRIKWRKTEDPRAGCGGNVLEIECLPQPLADTTPAAISSSSSSLSLSTSGNFGSSSPGSSPGSGSGSSPHKAAAALSGATITPSRPQQHTDDNNNHHSLGIMGDTSPFPIHTSSPGARAAANGAGKAYYAASPLSYASPAGVGSIGTDMEYTNTSHSSSASGGGGGGGMGGRSSTLRLVSPGGVPSPFPSRTALGAGGAGELHTPLRASSMAQHIQRQQQQQQQQQQHQQQQHQHQQSHSGRPLPSFPRPPSPTFGGGMGSASRSSSSSGSAGGSPRSAAGVGRSPLDHSSPKRVGGGYAAAGGGGGGGGGGSASKGGKITFRQVDLDG